MPALTSSSALSTSSPIADTWSELISSARKPRGDDARRAMLAMFDTLGPEYPLTREYRRRLQIVT